MDDIFIHYLDFGRDNFIPSAVTKNEDDTYSVFINTRVATNQQHDGLEHELGHILDMDFEQRQDKDSDRIEFYKHKIC